jgi:hypothetical protein
MFPAHNTQRWLIADLTSARDPLAGASSWQKKRADNGRASGFAKKPGILKMPGF